MKCLECGVEMKVVHENHKYSECGLDNVVIVNASKHKCTKCGEEYLDLPNPEDLHRVISEEIIKNHKKLDFKEFRFLRKHLGFSSTYFAKIVKISRETMSRYENGKSKIPTQMDLLIRALVMSKLPCRDYDYHDLILENDEKITESQLRIWIAKRGKQKGKWEKESALSKA